MRFRHLTQADSEQFDANCRIGTQHLSTNTGKCAIIRVMRNGRAVILAAAAMAAALVVAACGSEAAPLTVPTATPGPAPTAVPATEPPPAPTPVPAADPTATPTVEAVQVDEGPELPVLPVISTREHKLVGTQEWINSDPLTLEGLADEGKVVLIDFWTYT